MRNRVLERLAVLLVALLIVGATHAPAAEATSPVIPVGALLVDMASGDEGPQVAALQSTLRSLKMYRGEIDGTFGVETAVAVMTLTKYLDLERS